MLWSSTPVNNSGVGWQQALTAVVVEWTQRLDAEDRVPADLEAHITEQPHAAVLENAGFDVVGHYEFAQPHDWTVAELIGWVYSTSLLPRVVLGDPRGRVRIRRVRPARTRSNLRASFTKTASFAYDLRTKFFSRFPVQFLRRSVKNASTWSSASRWDVRARRRGAR